jgi:hypothetical protein
MDKLFDPPPAPSRSERDAVLQARLYEELRARDALNQDTDSRIAAFSGTANQDPCYDPLFIEFFSQTQAKVDHLRERLQDIRAGKITEADIAETQRRVAALTPFIVERQDSIHKHITTLEKRTGQIVAQKIPRAIAELEKQLELNKKLRQKLRELRETES